MNEKPRCALPIEFCGTILWKFKVLRRVPGAVAALFLAASPPVAGQAPEPTAGEIPELTRLLGAYREKQAETQVPSDLGAVLEVRAGGRASAVQLTNGAWKAWGPESFAVTEAATTGVALDLGLYVGENADYLIWIEPID